MEPAPPIRDDGPSLAELSDALLESAPDGTVLVDHLGRIVLVNRRAESMFGYDREDLVGQTLELLVPDELRARHRGLRDGYAREPGVRPMGIDLELAARRRDGSHLPVAVSLSPVTVGGRTYTIASVRDISAQRELKADRDRISAALDASADGVFLLDDEGHVRYANRGATRLLGDAPGSLAGRSIVVLLRPDGGAGIVDALGQLRRRECDRVTFTTDLGRRDGSVMSIELVVEPTPDRERALFLCLVRDITSRIESERTLRRAEQALLLAEDRERIARDLHDNVIQRLYASGLSLQASTALPQPAANERIEQVVEGIDDTIRELRHAVFELHRAAAGPGVIAREMKRTVRDAAQALGFTPSLTVGLTSALPTGVAADVLAVTREALANAARHARATAIDVTLASGSDGVRLVVDDDGLGVSAGALRGHGLDNMQARAKALHGECRVSTRSGGGTHVEWRVPLPLSTDPA